MKRVFFGFGLFAVAVVIGTGETNYPWCAQYSGGGNGGGTNCGFTTYEQRTATVSGIGGFCNRNTTYVPPPGPHPTTQKKMRSN